MEDTNLDELHNRIRSLNKQYTSNDTDVKYNSVPKKEYSEIEIKEFKNKTIENLTIQDPIDILADLGIYYKDAQANSYKIKVREENTASAFITLRSGSWKYKDFGSRNSGNIINVVMEYANKDFKDALNYCLHVTGTPNYLEEALQLNSTVYTISQEEKDRIRELREQNIQKNKSIPISKVTGVYEVSTNEMAIEYLKARGINKIPSNIKIISGEYTTKKQEIKKVFGVGVLTKDNTGADIHFLKSFGDLKTFSFGKKDISVFPSQASTKVAIFESKIDYASAYQEMPLDNVTVIIANTTSNSKKVADFLIENDLTKEVMFFNQNDKAGYSFVADIIERVEIDSIKAINYSIDTEYGKDINDILLESPPKIATRIVSPQPNYFSEVFNQLENLDNTSSNNTQKYR